MKTYEEVAKEVLRRRDEETARRAKRRAHTRAVCCAAAGLCAAALIGVGLWRAGLFAGDRQRWPVREVAGQASDNGEIAVIPKWEEMSISRQFSELNYRGVRYSSQVTPLAAGMVGEYLTQVELEGYDVYTDTAHRTTGTVYAIQGISEACAVAVSFAGTEGYYVYVNPYDTPETLEQLLSDLNLREHMTFGSVWYTFYDEREEEWVNVEFVNVPDSLVWELLLSDGSLENQPEPQEGVVGEMSVSVSIPVLGYENISLWVNRSGWMGTNILDTGKYFFLGTEQIDRFMDYVLAHCEGYEIRYTGGDGVEIPE